MGIFSTCFSVAFQCQDRAQRAFVLVSLDPPGSPPGAAPRNLKGRRAYPHVPGSTMPWTKGSPQKFQAE